jgi:hypothetical protein
MVAPDPLCARNSRFLATATPDASSCCTNAVVASCVVEVVVAAVGATDIPVMVAVAVVTLESERFAVPLLVVALVMLFDPPPPESPAGPCRISTSATVDGCATATVSMTDGCAISTIWILIREGRFDGRRLGRTRLG